MTWKLNCCIGFQSDQSDSKLSSAVKFQHYFCMASNKLIKKQANLSREVKENLQIVATEMTRIV